MTGSTSPSAPRGLERGYRRLVACYPRSFRKDNEEEVLTVLLATARDGQRRPSLAEAADLIRGAARMRMGLSRSPRTVLNAVRLMYLGAAVELGVLITVILTAGTVRAAVRAAVVHRDPAVAARALEAVNVDLVADLVVLPAAVVLWLWMAWANGRGHDWARLVAVSAFALYTMGMTADLARGAAAYAPAAVIVSGVAWAIGLAAIALVFCKQSWPYYARRAATR
jgi:hypothetical protein